MIYSIVPKYVKLFYFNRINFNICRGILSRHFIRNICTFMTLSKQSIMWQLHNYK